MRVVISPDVGATVKGLAKYSYVGEVALAVFGLSLVIAASLKLQSVIWPEIDFESIAGWWKVTEISVAISEWFLGTWVLTGISKTFSRRISVAVLMAFIFINGWRLFTAKSDCGCFSGFHVRPLWTFAFDAMILGLIYFFGPGNVRNSPSMGSAPAFNRVLFAIILSALLPLILLGDTYLTQRTSVMGHS